MFTRALLLLRGSPISSQFGGIRLLPGAVTSLSASSASRMSGVKPSVVFVLGPPGSGKGTQCAKIVEKFGYVHLSAGELLREEQNKSGSEFGPLIEGHMKGGTIVPVAITCSLLEREMNNSEKNEFVIDGFPRNDDNLTGWNKHLADKVDLKFVLFFRCDMDTCLKRCLARGASGSGRSDDNAETMQKRLVTYQKATMPIEDHYRKKGLMIEVDGTRSPEQVFTDVSKHFEKKVTADQGTG